MHYQVQGLKACRFQARVKLAPPHRVLAGHDDAIVADGPPGRNETEEGKDLEDMVDDPPALVMVPAV